MSDLIQEAPANPWFSDPLEENADPVLVEGTGAALSLLLARCLFREQQRHVLLTGEKGCGKTTVVREFARRCAAGEFPFLIGHRFLWVDCQHVGPEDSRGCLETILKAAEELGEVVLCLDGFDALLERPMGGSNKPLICAAAARSRVSIIGILSKWAFEDQISGDADLLELFTHIPVEEPPEETVKAIVRAKARQFTADSELTIPEEVADRTVSLAAHYILSESQPQKAIRVLQQACEDLQFDRTHLGSNETEVHTEDLVRVISERTGIPAETITGDATEADYTAALTAQVVGQDEAVAAVAQELQLIKAGLTEPGKPASVLLFAGMTGVGKTELAKQIARLYSSSGRLQTYTMGNFTEPHSISGIIGVPPGYVGHEAGGRLINELNADPYSVFLLDEAEKAHPNIWKPFLNLFDEGWITDQRGVKAYADRALFILTTNAGDRTITQMANSNKTPEEIAERVKQTLGRIRQERSSQPVFTPQFLARIKRLLVFRPLTEDALIEIVRKQLQQMNIHWQQKREKTVTVTEDAITAIGKHCHRLNEKAGGQEGGRIVRKVISEAVEANIQQRSLTEKDDYQQANTIACTLIPAPPAPATAEEPLTLPAPGIAVQFLT